MTAQAAPDLRGAVAGETDVRLRGRDVLCFSHDWTGDPLSKTHLMRLLARDNRVLWVNSIGYRTPSLASKSDMHRAFRKLAAMTTPLREAERNIFVLNPLAVPFYGPRGRAVNSRLLRWQVRRAMRALGFRRVLNWVFNPAAALIAGSLGEDLLIYYCVDEYTAFSGVPTASLVQMESDLLRKADLVIVSADRLLESKRRLNPNIHLVRHGVDVEHFRKALDEQTRVPQEVATLPRPVVGYFGLIAQDWVDVELLVHAANKLPHVSFVLIGKSTMDLSPLSALPNVHLLGRKPYESLPAYCKGFDAALIPFPISEVTLNANPLKAREYLAAGLPVVSTAIPEVEVLGMCRIGRDRDEFVREIEAALADPGDRGRRSRSMDTESWQARLDQVAGYIARTPRRVKSRQAGARP